MKVIVRMGWMSTALLAWTAVAGADEAPDPSQIRIVNISANGSGCQSGSVSHLIAGDGQTFSLFLDHYEASSGGAKREDRKSCEIDLELATPPGWSFTVFSADYRGFAQVEPNSSALHQVVYSFYNIPNGRGTGNSNGPPGSQSGRFAFDVKEFRGPYSGDYLAHNEIAPQNLAWSPCDPAPTRTLHISTSLVTRTLTRAAPPRALITLDTVDGAIGQRFGIRWRRCEAAPPRNDGGRPGLPGRGRGGPRRF